MPSVMMNEMDDEMDNGSAYEDLPVSMPREVMTIQASPLEGLGDTAWSLAKVALLGFVAWKGYQWLTGTQSGAGVRRGAARLGRSAWAGAAAARTSWRGGTAGLGHLSGSLASSGGEGKVARKPMTVSMPGREITVYVRAGE